MSVRLSHHRIFCTYNNGLTYHQHAASQKSALNLYIRYGNMGPETERAVCTAQPEATIWSRVSENEFRQNLVALEHRTNAVPLDVLVFLPKDAATDPLRLPLRVEQQVADDLAFLVAVQEGAQSVAAVYLEQNLAKKALVVHVAAADSVGEDVRARLTRVCDILACVSRGSSNELNQMELLFDQIINQHQYKILSRLRSRRWEKPRYLAASHKKPLWQDFENVIHRVQHIYPSKKDKMQRQSIGEQLEALRRCYQALEYCDNDVLVLRLQALVKSTYVFCKHKDVAQYAARLTELRPTAQIAAAVKCLSQLEKIGAYWRIAIDLVSSAIRYPRVFGEIKLVYLLPFASVPTSIAYESWAKTCHVHAEIQLVIEHDLQLARSERQGCEVLPPRIIGTSKYLCYLCYLFIQHHGRFFVANTHGRLYDQWTVPDLAEYCDQTKAHYATLLAEMNEMVCKQLAGETRWRPEPMTSRQNLLQT